MTNRIVDLRKPALPNGPSLGNLEGLKPAKAHHIHQILMAQDQPLGVGRRVLVSLGMKGRPENEVSDVDVDDGDDYQAHVEETTERIIHRLDSAPVSPGHALQIEVRCLPSGPTGGSTGGATDYSGDSGSVKIAVTWNNSATTETVNSELNFPAWQTPYGHGVDVAGMGFTQLQEKTTTNFPSDAFFDSDDLATWSGDGVGHASVDIVVSYIGGARPVDIVVHEIPWKIARDGGVPAAPAHIYQQFEQAIEAFPFGYPVEGASSGDQRFGAQHVLNVMKEHGRRLAPMVCAGSSHVSGQITALDGSDYIPTPWTFDSTSYVELGFSSSPSGDAPSWDIGAASHGRLYSMAAPEYAIDDTSVIHVLVSARVKVDAGTGTLKFWTADHSYVELETTSTSWEWVTADAYLECGSTVLDQMTLQIFGKATSTDTLSVTDFAVFGFLDG